MGTDLEIVQGSTFRRVVRWETSPLVYKAIEDITQSAPAVLTITGHGVPERWRVAVVSVQGMTEINAPNPPKAKHYKRATVLDADTIELNDVNSTEFSPYESGGYIQYNTPVDLTGFAARMKVKNKVGGTELFELTTENGRIVLDVANARIELVIDAEDTEEITWKKGVYDLEMVSPDGTPVVTKLLTGRISVVGEVTT